MSSPNSSSTSFSNLINNPSKVTIKGILSEAWLVAGLAVQLAKNFGSRLIWIWMFFRFLIYISLLLIPFIRAGWIFLISDYIKRSVPYGPNPRNYLDIYTASDIMTRFKANQSPRHSSHRISKENKYPVVIFLSGGAWIIGYKCWGAFMGMLLAQLGVIFVSPDYRNFPQGTISDMVEDATNAVEWTKENIYKYGGDKNKIYIISQSAGAHIGALMMLMQAKKIEIFHKLKSYLIELKQYKQYTQYDKIQKLLLSEQYESLWNPREDIKAFIGIAGPYNIEGMRDHLSKRGLYLDVMDKIMENDLRRASPLHFLYDSFVCLHEKNEHHQKKKKEEKREFADELDKILNDKIELKLSSVYLFHGSKDLSCPVTNTYEFSVALARFGVETFVKIYANKSHTAPIIEDPITGKDPLVCDMLQIIYPHVSLHKIVHEIEQSMTGGLHLPKIIIDLASYVCPF